MNTHSGFTLIELIVAISIFVLVTGIALVNYRSLNQRQELSQSAQGLQEALRFAQKKARVGEKPPGCDAPAMLEGYRVRAVANGNSYQIFADCTNGDFSVTDSTLLLDKVQFNMSANLNILFKVLAGGVNAPVTIRLINEGLQYQFDIQNGGEIEEGGFL